MAWCNSVFVWKLIRLYRFHILNKFFIEMRSNPLFMMWEDHGRLKDHLPLHLSSVSHFFNPLSNTSRWDLPMFWLALPILRYPCYIHYILHRQIFSKGVKRSFRRRTSVKSFLSTYRPVSPFRPTFTPYLGHAYAAWNIWPLLVC
jgi:hypothetical protein